MGSVDLCQKHKRLTEEFLKEFLVRKCEFCGAVLNDKKEICCDKRKEKKNAKAK